MFEAFQFGPLLLRTHVLFVILGIIFSLSLFLRLAESEGLQLQQFLTNSHWYLLSFLLGGRLFAMIVLYRVYFQDPLRMFILWDGGFSYLGGCIGVCVALFIFTYSHRTTFLQWLDELTPAIMLGWACEWIGRFFGNISYGKPTDMPWGIEVSSMQVRYTVPIHPVQLYYAFALLFLTFLILVVRRKANRRAGLTTFVGIVCSALFVLGFEFFRGDFAVLVFAKLSDVAFIGILFISLGIIMGLEKRISSRFSLINSIAVGCGTLLYIAFRSYIPVFSFEWRFTQFLAVLAVLAVSVYVVVHRWKYPHL